MDTALVAGVDRLLGVRVDQGLPPRITDAVTLARIAAIVTAPADGREEMSA